MKISFIKKLGPYNFSYDKNIKEVVCTNYYEGEKKYSVENGDKYKVACIYKTKLPEETIIIEKYYDNNDCYLYNGRTYIYSEEDKKWYHLIVPKEKLFI